MTTLCHERQGCLGLESYSQVQARSFTSERSDSSLSRRQCALPFDLAIRETDERSDNTCFEFRRNEGGWKAQKRLTAWRFDLRVRSVGLVRRF